MIPTLKDVELKGKKVIIRTGFDVPVDEDGNIEDTSRILASIPSIKYILAQGARQLIIMFHIGRPEKNEEHLKSRKVANTLERLLGQPVVKVDGWSNIPINKIIVLENLRFNKAEASKDQKERDEFGKQLASLADIYVNDAFPNCHRDHASMTSVPKFIPGCIGFSVENEVSVITKALENPEKPVKAVIAGLKADKMEAIKNLLSVCDKIMVAGALSFTLLKAKGIEVGNSKIDNEGLAAMKDEMIALTKNPKILLPVDAVIADRFDAEAEAKTVSVEKISSGWMALDIGPKTVELYKKELSSAKTIMWFGPIGVFEWEKFAKGTEGIANAIAESDAVKIVGGGDSGAAANKFGVADRMTLVSSGGGVSLDLISGKKLAAIEALRKE